MLKRLMFSSNFSHEFSLIHPSGDSCWYEWRTTGHKPHWGCVLLFLPLKVTDMAQHFGSDLVFKPNYWTLDFQLKRCDICQLNKSKPLHTHTQRSGPKDVPVTSYPHGRNKRTSSQSRCLSFQLTSAYAHGVFCVSVLPSDNRSRALEGVPFHICVFLSMDEQKVTSLDELQWKIEQHRKQYVLFHCPNKYNQFKMA